MRFLHNSYHKPKKNKGILVFYFLLSILLTCLVLFQASCTTVKYVPLQGEHKIEYRDSIIHLKDTLTLYLEKERIVEIVPDIDTSRVETSVAKSTAYLDKENKKLIHEIENKPSVKAKIDTVFVVVNKTEYIKEPVIQEVEKEVPYIPTWCWIIICYACITAGFKIYKFIK